MNFDRELVGIIAIVGTTHHVGDSANLGQLRLLRSCAKALSAKLNSPAYDALGVPLLREFILD